MGWFSKTLKNIAKTAGPVLGSALGSYFLPGLGLSPALGGALGGAAAGALAGGKKGRLGGALGGGAMGYMTGPSLASGAAKMFGQGGATGTIRDMFGGKDVWGNLDDATRLAGGSTGNIQNQFSNIGSGQGAGNAATAMAQAPAGAAPSMTGAPTAAGGGPALAQGGFMDFLKNNPELVAAAPALVGAFMGNREPEGVQEMRDMAKQAGAISSRYASGQLGPADQTAVDQATRDAEAAIRSKYASMGLSGSTMEMQDIQAARERAQVMGRQLASQSLNTALQGLNLSSGLYGAIANLQMQEDQAMADAIANFTSALGYGMGTQKAA